MSEKQMRKTLVAATRGVLHFEHISDRLRKGVADEVWVDNSGNMGWLELKYLPRVKDGDEWFIPELRTDQIVFLSTQRRHFGSAAVLLRVGKPDYWFLYAVSENLEVALRLQKPLQPCVQFWKGTPTRQSLAFALAKVHNLEPRGFLPI